MCLGPPASASPASREKAALEEAVEALRGEAAVSHAEKQSLEARNAELQRSLRQCAEQKEALEQQGERGRRALESRWATQPSAGTLAPGPRVTHLHQPHQGVLGRPPAPLTPTTTHRHSHAHPKSSPVPALPPWANPPRYLGPTRVDRSVGALCWPRLSPRS